jgi:hypothetical protein
MADGFIVRKGGAVTEQALAPTITEVSNTDTEIVFTITNNDASTAVILYEAGDTTPDENSIELATGVTSSNLTITGLTPGTTYTVYAWATVTGKTQSALASEAIETDITYTSATGGATEEYDSGGKRYKSHTFTSDDDFEVTAVGNGDRNQVDYLIIAGGGGGGHFRGGGGGAGGYLSTITPTPSDTTPKSKVTVTAQTYGIVIGAGGTGGETGTTATATGVNGTASTAFGESATGGGGGAGAHNNANQAGFGQNGGSGGGALHNDESGSTSDNGEGISGQGRDGGTSSSSTPYKGAGGGGAGQVGASPTGATTTGNAGDGGDGLANSLRTGSSETRAGGGGGGTNTFATAGSGGTGGGGNGSNSGNGSNGTANTGGGGGGSEGNNGTFGGDGGSGIVIIRYEIAPSV